MSDQKPIFTTALPNLDHLWLRATLHVAEPNAFGAHLDDWHQPHTERTFDGERAPHTAAHQPFDSFFMSTEIAKCEVQSNGQHRGTHDAEKVCEKTPARHELSSVF